jgi:hypothetical protein
MTVAAGFVRIRCTGGMPVLGLLNSHESRDQEMHFQTVTSRSILRRRNQDDLGRR